MWNVSVVQNNTSTIPDQRRRTHRIDRSQGSSVRCAKKKSVVVLSPQSQIVPIVQKRRNGWAAIGLAAWHANWKMEQVHRADQALYPMQSGSFVARGP